MQERSIDHFSFNSPLSLLFTRVGRRAQMSDVPGMLQNVTFSSQTIRRRSDLRPRLSVREIVRTLVYRMAPAGPARRQVCVGTLRRTRHRRRRIRR
jgi:hypothetical protein